MKRLITILLLLFTFASVDAQRAGWWYGNAPGEAAAGPDTLTLTYWNDFVLLHIANTGITEDANGVSQWQDRSGNGNHSTQTVNANKPSTDVDGNVVFDGIDNYLNMADLFSLGTDTAFTLFLVAETGSTVVSTFESVFWYEQYINSTDENSVLFRVVLDSITSDLTRNSINYAVRDGNTPSKNWEIIGADTLSVLESFISVIAARESVGFDTKTNGVSTGSKATDGSWYANNFPPSIGSQRTTSIYFSGKIKFIGIANRKFTPAEIATTETELNSFFTIY